MTTSKKLLLQILEGRADANVAFDGLCRLMHALGFSERMRGSHHIFRMDGVEEKLNLQRDDGKAKPYQGRQVRAVILRYRFAERVG